MSELCVLVEAMNDEGDTESTYGFGQTVDEAIEDALDFIVEATGDGSYVMNEWMAA